MDFVKVNFPPILHDNEVTYFNYLEGVIASVDNDAVVQVTRRNQGITVRICPAEASAFDIILQHIKKYHNIIGIHLDFSKSMKAGNNITFGIDY